MESDVSTTYCDVVVETENTFWYLRGDLFTRIPKNEVKRSPLETVEGPQFDGEWKKFDVARLEWFYTDFSMTTSNATLRVIPSGRHEGARGIVSSQILAITANPKEQSNE